MRAAIRAGLARAGPEVGALCLTILLADVVAGIVAPTFSLYASGLGVSLALLGALTTAGGLAQLVAALPLGILSDRVGRPGLIVAGLLAFAAALLSFSVAAGAALLFVGRALMGLATVATFQLGAAHLGDITARGRRAVAFGLYATAMGLGFTIGPVLGSQLAARAGPRQAYLVGAALASAAAAVAARTLRGGPPGGRRAGRGPTPRRVGRTLARPDLLLVSFGNLLVGLTFAGAVTTFFPLYGRAVGLSEATIGALFAVRALVSALGRLPNGLISRALGNQAVMLGALGLDAAAMLGVAHSRTPAALALLLVAEGLAYGAYLVAGQTYVAEHTDAPNRGAAVGLYALAASVGGTAGPVALGLLAARRGLPAVFTATGWALLAGLACSAVGAVALARSASALREAIEP
ncbi:MAG TPA: MFS transporter [Thermomicrobiales bacterium]|nr:MFS transporter [Thermomicrobiales bacterium]